VPRRRARRPQRRTAGRGGDLSHLRHAQGRVVRRQRGRRREPGHRHDADPHRHPEQRQPAGLADRCAGADGWRWPQPLQAIGTPSLVTATWYFVRVRPGEVASHDYRGEPTLAARRITFWLRASLRAPFRSRR
jgi:hypothetical protein